MYGKSQHATSAYLIYTNKKGKKEKTFHNIRLNGILRHSVFSLRQAFSPSCPVFTFLNSGCMVQSVFA
jgi:hypothetical protein